MCSIDDTHILVSAYHRHEKQGTKGAMKPPTFYNFPYKNYVLPNKNYKIQKLHRACYGKQGSQNGVA